jgi:hypothetical protein
MLRALEDASRAHKTAKHACLLYPLREAQTRRWLLLCGAFLRQMAVGALRGAETKANVRTRKRGFALSRGSRLKSRIFRKGGSNMERVMISIVSVMLVVFFAAGLVQAGETAQQMDRGCAARECTYTGWITSINQTRDRIIVSGDEGDKSFVLLSDPPLRLNEKVDVYYTEKDGRLIASSVKAARPYQVPKKMEEYFRFEMQQS